MEHSSLDETVVGNLASIALPSFIRGERYEFQKLHDVTKIIALNLNCLVRVTTLFWKPAIRICIVAQLA
jgi:ribonucleoside-diphosphate reductase subunit M1